MSVVSLRLELVITCIWGRFRICVFDRHDTLLGCGDKTTRLVYGARHKKLDPFYEIYGNGLCVQ